MDYISVLVSDLKLYKKKLLEESLTFIDIKNDLDLIKQGISFDDNHTCFYGYDDINDVITSLVLSTDTYGIFLEDEYIAIASFDYHYYKDLTRKEVCLCIKEKYRRLGIGYLCFLKIIDECFKEPLVKCIHLTIREDNIASKKMAESLGFKEYKGYKASASFTDLDKKIIHNNQYLLKKEDF